MGVIDSKITVDKDTRDMATRGNKMTCMVSAVRGIAKIQSHGFWVKRVASLWAWLYKRDDNGGIGGLLRSWFRYVQPGSSDLNRIAGSRQEKRKSIRPQDKDKGKVV